MDKFTFIEDIRDLENTSTNLNLALILKGSALAFRRIVRQLQEEEDCRVVFVRRSDARMFVTFTDPRQYRRL
jgi:hypothetical protein